MITHDDVRRIASQLPNVHERPSFGGRPSWRTGNRMFIWIRDKPEALVVWVDSVEERDAMIGAEPTKFFTTPHYDGYPMLLVNLDGIDAVEASELIEESWRIRAPRKKRRGPLSAEPR